MCTTSKDNIQCQDVEHLSKEWYANRYVQEEGMLESLDPACLKDIVTKMEIEYAPQYDNEIVLDISDDEWRLEKIRMAIQTLEPSDKNLFLIYLYAKTLRATAKLMSVSHQLIQPEIARILNQIREKVKEYDD